MKCSRCRRDAETTIRQGVEGDEVCLLCLTETDPKPRRSRPAAKQVQKRRSG